MFLLVFVSFLRLLRAARGRRGEEGASFDRRVSFIYVGDLAFFASNVEQYLCECNLYFDGRSRGGFSYAIRGSACSALACLLAVTVEYRTSARREGRHCTPSQQTCLAWEEICVLKWGMSGRATNLWRAGLS